MIKKISICIILSTLFLLLISGNVFALNFQNLPSGMTGVVPNSYEVVQTGETDDGVVYVVSTYTSGVKTYVWLMGFSKPDGSIVYNTSYEQFVYDKKISAKSKNYYYILAQENSTVGKVKKINLSTGQVVATIDGPITYVDKSYQEWVPDPSGKGGYYRTVTVFEFTAGGYPVKYIAVSNTDKVYVLGKETGNNNNRILKWSGGSWVRVLETTFPGADATSEPTSFCAPTDDIWYSSFATNVYRTEGSSHNKITLSISGNGVIVHPGINDKDAIFLLYDNSYGYVYYYNRSTNILRNAIGASYFLNKYYNLVYLPNSNKASFSYWNGYFAIWAIGDNGVATPVQLTTPSYQTVPFGSPASSGSYSGTSGSVGESGSISLSSPYYVSNSVIGGFGVKTMNSWVITRTTSNYSGYPTDTMLSPILPSYWAQQATYIVNDGSTTDGSGWTPEGGTTGTGGTTGGTGSVSATSVFRVVKDVDFVEFVYDKLVDAATTVDGVTATPVDVPNSTQKYTKLTGKFTTIDAANPSKAVVIGGRLLIFKVIAPPTNSQTVTLQLSK